MSSFTFECDLSIANRDSTVIRMYLANKVMGCQRTGNCVANFGGIFHGIHNRVSQIQRPQNVDFGVI